MNLEKVMLHNNMMQIMYEKFNTKYLFMLGNYIIEGMPIESAIYQCWNNLMTKTNG